ncbi:MAG: Coenzyme F420 hydrogenase/dehydrogenase, beta subunit C-terminal domain [Chlorobium sp.]|nr:Coenzyme F420 hydrogenase/dehydrogenase, beta subunit C-terminal domain [Chlorobium sp.]
MIVISDKSKCCGCEACIDKCPKKCIKIYEDCEGFLYPETDCSICIDCGICEKTCPVINQHYERIPLNVYAVKNKNDEIRKNSSSGGIFTTLGETVIDNGGVVFGAKYNDIWEVVHDYTETKEGLRQFRGSKYVQSKINGSFSYAERFLNDGREVLFSGAPCQIAGLKLFLKKDYDNLITVDFVCHGVPSPMVFKLYIKELNESKNGKIVEINMRDKIYGWRKYSFSIIRMMNGGLIKTSDVLNENIYRKGFLYDIYLRPSCHDCPAKNFKSGSDITIGDYWGVEKIHPEFNDDNGVSLVCIHNEKIILSNDNCFFVKSDIHQAIKYNKYISISAKKSPYRERFFKKINNTPIIELINKYSRNGMFKAVYLYSRRSICAVLSTIRKKMI